MSAEGLPDMLPMKNDYKLKCYYWNPDITDPGALIFICHGFCEHSGYYDEIAGLFTASGCFVFAHDHVGHGHSEGDRAQIKHFNQYTNDLFEHYDLIVDKYPSAKRFVIGHSMGGAIATLAALEKPDYFSGIVMIAPAFSFYEQPGCFKVNLLRFISTLLPSVQLKALDPKLVSQNEALVKRYTEDPLVWHGGIKLQWLYAMDNAMRNISSKSCHVEWPFFILHGTEDKVTSIDGSAEFFKNAKSSDKTFKSCESLYHQLHYEPTSDQILDEIKNWIIKRI